eukprot:TRINITY_DN67035_c5_g1_i1.p1 TRINITY_DN67035_c5_g1~~TRINITY_DN67035_c5_g1_i1.p1  ORF type:complete len:327 (-),score=20.10 TRINITY_DN67035_c5_g1_i1:750-1730(-)
MRFSLSCAPNVIPLGLCTLSMFITLPWWVYFLGLLATWGTYMVVLKGKMDNFKKIKEGKLDAPWVLNSIPISHFVEKIRWSLDMCELPYIEEMDAGIMGVLTTGRSVPNITIPDASSHIGNSSDILRYLYGRYGHTNPRLAEYLQPTPEAIELEKSFDRMGVAIQRWVYGNATEKGSKSSSATLRAWGLNHPMVPWWQQLILKFGFPVIVGSLRKGFNMNQKNSARALDIIKENFTKVEDKLSDGRKYLLNGDRPTFVDVTFASLAGVLMGDDLHYGNGKLKGVLPNEDEIPPSIIPEFRALQDSVAGKFAKRMLAEHRGDKLGGR